MLENQLTILKTSKVKKNANIYIAFPARVVPKSNQMLDVCKFFLIKEFLQVSKNVIELEY